MGAAAAIDLNPTKAVICLGAACALWPLRKIAAAYIIPVLSVPALCAIVVALRSEWEAGRTGVGFAGLGDQEMAPHGLAEAVSWVGVMSVAIALMNMLPLYGLDNGKVVGLLLHRWAPHWVVTGYQYAGLALIAITLVASLASDLWAFWTAIS